MALLDTVLGRIIAPTGAVGFALLAEERDWGLFTVRTEACGETSMAT